MTRAADIELELDVPSERARFLEFCSQAPTAADHLDSILAAEINWLVIGREVVGVAQAEAGSTASRVRLKAVIRGLWGSEIEAHATDDPFAFVFQFIPLSYVLRTDLMPIGEGVEFKAIPYSFRGVVAEDEYTFGLAELENRSRRPYPVRVLSSEVVGDDWSVTVRPRWHNRGAATYGDIETDLASFTGEVPEGYEFFVEPLDALGESLADPVAVAVTFTADEIDADNEDDDADGAGVVDFAFTAPTDTATLRLYQAFNGILGYPTDIAS